MNKLLLTICCCALLLSCKKKDIEVPSYLHIPGVTLLTTNTEGSGAHGVEYVTVYINDNPIGTYHLPVTFPLLHTGNQKIDVRAQIKQLARNGLSSYSMFSVYSKNIDLAAGRVDTLRPAFTYFPTRKFAWLEDFNNMVSSFRIKSGTIDTFYIQNDPAISLDGTPYCYIPMGTGETFFEIESTDLFDLPKDGRDVYLEINYRSNVDFTIGTFVSTPNQVISLPSVSPFSTGLEWKKGYVYLRDETNNQPFNAKFRIFFRAVNAEVTNPEIFIDNIKLLYREG